MTRGTDDPASYGVLLQAGQITASASAVGSLCDTVDRRFETVYCLTSLQTYSACPDVKLRITGSPAGLSRVNGVGPSSAKMIKFNRLPSHNYESFVFKFGKGDNVTQISNPAKFGWDRMIGGAPT